MRLLTKSTASAPALFSSALLSGLLLLSLAACAPTIAKRGTFFEPEDVAAIQVGVSTRANVLDRLGSPTQVGTFDDKTWYYVGQTTEQTAFFDPKIVERRGVVIVFNDEGIVSSLDPITPEDEQSVHPVSRRTPTYGHETTVLEQLLGNIGRPGSLNKGKAN